MSDREYRRSRHRQLAMAAALAIAVFSLVWMYLRLARQEGLNSRLETQLAASRLPQANTPILRLSPERSADLSVQPPTHRVRLPASAAWIVLSLQLERPEFSRYGVTLLGEDEQLLWRAEGLAADEHDALVLSLHSNSLAPGDYLLRVSGLPGDEEPSPVAQYTLRVLASAAPGH